MCAMLLGKSSSVFSLSADDLSRLSNPPKKNTQNAICSDDFVCARVLHFFVSNFAYYHRHSLTLTFTLHIARFTSAGNSKYRRIPCIDIFNNSLYYASTERATACRTSSNCSPHSIFCSFMPEKCRRIIVLAWAVCVFFLLRSPICVGVFFSRLQLIPATILWKFHARKYCCV